MDGVAQNTWFHPLNQSGTYVPGIHMSPLKKIPPKSHPGLTWKMAGKHLERTWNPPNSTQIPLRFHAGPTPVFPWNIPGFDPQQAWTTWIPCGIQQHTHTLCGIYLNSMELPWNMWNQCGFHVDRWGSVNC
jgi:hypothetical protein